MVKEQGSLGFTLRKEDESVLGHCVRALVRQPATTDGRIRPGDKIVAVNDVEMCQLTHEQAVVFLRMAGDQVKLRLYREEVQTPVAGPAATAACGGGDATDDAAASSSGVRTKTNLRPEAITLLSDLAWRNRKQQTLGSEADLSGTSIRSAAATAAAATHTGTSPRRLKRGGHRSGTATGATSAATTSDEGSGHRTDTTSTSASVSFSYPRYIVTSQPTTSVGSDSEASSSISQCSFVVQPAGGGGAEQLQSLPSSGDYYEEDELWRVDEDDGDGSAFRRSAQCQSSSGSLAGKSGSTPVSSRKPRFQFTGEYERFECLPHHPPPLHTSLHLEHDF